MRIGRAIIIPTVLSLSVAGALLSGPAMFAAAGHEVSVHPPAVALTASPNTLFHT
jgi:hypothetical protein